MYSAPPSSHSSPPVRLFFLFDTLLINQAQLTLLLNFSWLAWTCDSIDLYSLSFVAGSQGQYIAKEFKKTPHQVVRSSFKLSFNRTLTTEFYFYRIQPLLSHFYFDRLVQYASIFKTVDLSLHNHDSFYSGSFRIVMAGNGPSFATSSSSPPFSSAQVSFESSTNSMSFDLPQLLLWVEYGGYQHPTCSRIFLSMLVVSLVASYNKVLQLDISFLRSSPCSSFQKSRRAGEVYIGLDSPYLS